MGNLPILELFDVCLALWIQFQLRKCCPIKLTDWLWLALSLSSLFVYLFFWIEKCNKLQQTSDPPRMAVFRWQSIHSPNISGLNSFMRICAWHFSQKWISFSTRQLPQNMQRNFRAFWMLRETSVDGWNQNYAECCMWQNHMRNNLIVVETGNWMTK